MVLADRIAAALGAREEQERLLDVRRELQQVHDLGDAGAAHVAQPGDVGVVGHLAAPDEAVHPFRQRHQTRQARNPAARLRRRLARRGGRLYRATRTLFHHRGGRTTHKAFSATDRCAVIGVIKLLLKCQESGGDESPDWWAPLRRVRAAPDDDCAFAPGVASPMRTIFRDLVIERMLQRMPAFGRMGIVE